MTGGRVVLINGAPASGKTTLAQTLQTTMLRAHDQRWLALHLDELIFMTMGPFFGRGRGLWHQPVDHVRSALVFDEATRPLADAIVYSTTACARAGLDVIADAAFHDARARRLWNDELDGLWVLRVGLVCPYDTLMDRARQREARGGPPAALTAHYVDSVHEGVHYDLEIDMGVADPQAAAKQVAERILSHR